MADFHKNLRKSLRRDCEDIQLAKLLAAAEKSLISANLLSEVDAINRIGTQAQYTGSLLIKAFLENQFQKQLFVSALENRCF